MGNEFNPYHKWLGIPPKDQPPHLYRLLGIALFETDPDVIDSAANRIMAYLKDMAAGAHSDESQKLLNEVAAARITLLNKEKRKAYDEQLRALLPADSDSQPHRPPVAKPAVKRRKKKSSPQPPEPTSQPAPAAVPPVGDHELQQALASISSSTLKQHANEEAERPNDSSATRQMLLFGGIGAGALGVLLIICMFAFSGGETGAAGTAHPDAGAEEDSTITEAPEDTGKEEEQPPPPAEPEIPEVTGGLTLRLQEGQRRSTEIRCFDSAGKLVDLEAAVVHTMPTHLTYRLPLGKYRLELHRPTLMPFVKEIEVTQDSIADVSPAWVERVDGDCVSFANGEAQGAPVPVGPHRFNQYYVMIGAQPNANGQPEMFFQGEIREVRVSTVPLYTSDFTVPDDLRSMRSSYLVYQFNEGQGSRATNTSGVKMDLHGQINEATWVPLKPRR